MQGGAAGACTQGTGRLGKGRGGNGSVGEVGQKGQDRCSSYSDELLPIATLYPSPPLIPTLASPPLPSLPSLIPSCSPSPILAFPHSIVFPVTPPCLLSFHRVPRHPSLALQRTVVDQLAQMQKGRRGGWTPPLLSRTPPPLPSTAMAGSPLPPS